MDGSYSPNNFDQDNNNQNKNNPIRSILNAIEHNDETVVVENNSNAQASNVEYRAEDLTSFDYFLDEENSFSLVQTDSKKDEKNEQENHLASFYSNNSDEAENTYLNTKQILIIDPKNLKDRKYLGKGSYAQVYQYTYFYYDKDNKICSELVAVKEEIGSREEFNEKVEKELRKLTDIEHENIIKTLGKCPSIEKCDSIVMEYAETSLESLLRDTRQALVDANYTPVKIPDSICLKMILQLASALKAAHAKGHIHADLSSKNVLIKKRPNDLMEMNEIVLKIIDFSDETKTEGTPSYMAPELVLKLVENPTKESDVYSFGVLCHEILTLEAPFENRRAAEVYWFHRDGNRFSFRDYPECPQKIAEIISECFNIVQHRPTFNNLFERLEKLKSEYPDEDYYEDEQEWDENYCSLSMEQSIYHEPNIPQILKEEQHLMYDYSSIASANSSSNTNKSYDLNQLFLPRSEIQENIVESIEQSGILALTNANRFYDETVHLTSNSEEDNQDNGIIETQPQPDNIDEIQPQSSSANENDNQNQDEQNLNEIPIPSSLFF
jgi:serine/threonine protein kinase